MFLNLLKETILHSTLESKTDSASMQRTQTLLNQLVVEGLPRRQEEEWKYTSLKTLEGTRFEKQLQSQLEVVSQECILDSSLQELEQKELDWKTKIPSQDFFDRLASASLSRSYILRVPKNTSAALDLNIFLAGQEYLNSTLFIYIETAASLEVVETQRLQSGFLNQRIFIHLEKNSRCEFLRLMKIKNETSENNLSSSAAGLGTFFIGSLHTYQEQDSHFKFVQLGEGAEVYRQNVHAHLKAEGANAEIYGFNLLKENLSVDNNIHCNHWKGFSTSHQFFKTILNLNTKSVFQGRIFIERDAQKSQAQQLSKSLMLSEKCTVDTKPQLDVFADDVKATHGAAIGHLDKDELFYLQSRGLSPEQALGLLISAYGLEIAGKLEGKKLLTRAQKYLQT